MTTWGVTVRALATTVVLLGACSGDDDPGAATTTSAERPTTTTTTAPERQASTTTTAHDPATVEGAVEAAYLRSWDVYADAVYDLVLDERALAEVYAEESLEGKVEEIAGRVRDERAALVVVEHDYEILMVSTDAAHVVDRFVNHQVLIDPETKAPIEDDPNERLLFNFQMKRFPSGWRVTLIEEVSE